MRGPDCQKDWTPTYLIQRLDKPHEPVDMTGDPSTLQRFMRGNGSDGPFSFGGGPGSGHSEIAKQILGMLYSYDYMGAAEFEFGAVGASVKAMFDRIQQNMGQEVREIGLRVPDIIRPGDRRFKSASDFPRRHPDRFVDKKLYIICLRKWLDEGMPIKVVRREAGCSRYTKPESWPDDVGFSEWMSRHPGDRLKEVSRLWSALMADDHSEAWSNPCIVRTIGGLEIDNGWAYFVRAETAAYFWLALSGPAEEVVPRLITEEDASKFVGAVQQLIEAHTEEGRK